MGIKEKGRQETPLRICNLRRLVIRYDGVVAKLGKLGVAVRETDGFSDTYYYFHAAYTGKDQIFIADDAIDFICLAEAFISGFKTGRKKAE